MIIVTACANTWSDQVMSGEPHHKITRPFYQNQRVEKRCCFDCGHSHVWCGVCFTYVYLNVPSGLLKVK